MPTQLSRDTGMRLEYESASPDWTGVKSAWQRLVARLAAAKAVLCVR